MTSPGGVGPRGRIGRVILVGAGPGDPDLITVRGVAALASADVVLYDSLSTRELLGLAPAHAQCIDVGKRAHEIDPAENTAPPPGPSKTVLLLIVLAGVSFVAYNQWVNRPNDTPAPTEVSVLFPVNSMGQLYTRHSEASSHSDAVWEPFAQAEGIITVKIGLELQLEL